MTRRDLFKVSTIALASMIMTSANANELPQVKKNNKQSRVVICGGGFSGLTMAKYLRVYNPNIEVILIDKKDVFVSCPYSNVWLGEADDITLEDLTRDYFYSANKYGYNLLHANILDINRDSKKVITDICEIEYDYVVLALGIEYDYSYLFKDNQDKANKCKAYCPPALMPVGEHIALKRELKNLKDGNFVITVPSGVYRCPPAPYERACMVANYIKKHKLNAKVLIFDTREKPAAKADGFLDTFATLYKDIIEYHPMSEIKDVDFDKKEISILKFDKTKLDYAPIKVQYSVANIIPKNKAHHLIQKANIKTIDDGGYAVLKEPTFVSVSDDSVYVIGDNTAYPYPKSAHMANFCANLAAKELAHKIAKIPYDVYKETPANVCFSLVGDNPKEGLAVYHTVSFDNGIKVSAIITPKREAMHDSIRSWYDSIIDDILG